MISAAIVCRSICKTTAVTAARFSSGTLYSLSEQSRNRVIFDPIVKYMSHGTAMKPRMMLADAISIS